MRDSAFKKSLAELPVGSEAEISGPDGNFILPNKTAASLVFVTGGIGITPFISMLRFIQKNKLPYEITILYSNNDEKSTAFLKELKSWAEKNSKINLVLTMTKEPDFQGEKRLIDSQFIKEYVPDWRSSIFMLSGPPGMVKAIRGELKKLDVDRKEIKFEEFIGY
jgi:ferredoxin-NADP reductase